MSDRKQTILIVDDVPDDIVILDEILKNDYQVKAVTSGAAALKIAQGDNPPDLILLDIMMPEMDGFEVCRRLKQDTRGAMIPVIFLTAKVMIADEKMGFVLGAVDYIKKPVDPEIVSMRIKMHLEQKDRALCASEIKFRRLFETSKDGVMIFDRGTGLVIDANPSMAALLGQTQEYFLGRKVSELAFLESLEYGKAKSPGGDREGYVRKAEEPLNTADGREIYVQYIFNSYIVNNRELTQLNIRDISDLVRAERERDKLYNRLSHYLSTSPTVTYSLILKDRATRWQWVSENIGGLLGYTSEEALAPDWWFNNLHSADRAGALGWVKDLVENETAVREYRFARKDRSCVWLRDEMRLLRGVERDIEIVGTLTDISARKKAEEETHLKSEALEAAANAVIITDPLGDIKWSNRAFELLTGYSKAEVIGKRPQDLVGSGQEKSNDYGAIWDTILSGNTWNGELVNKRKSGELYTAEMTITPVRDGAKAISNFIAVQNDISERKKKEELIRNLLSEKEVLLREVHHRIKNNMNTIRGLLAMQIAAEKNAKAAESLRDAESRVQTIMLLYDRLYCTENYRELALKDYVRPLVEEIAAGFPMAGKVKIDTDIEDFILNVSLLSPLGIIVNEIVTNMMKHAFEGRDSGKIGVSASLKGNRAILILRDDGIGMPESVNFDNSTGFGMQIVRMLTEQMGGRITLDRKNGTSFTLEFTKDKNGKR